MKKGFYLILIPILMFSCGKKSNFTVSGKIEAGSGKTVYFSKLLVNSEQTLDSAGLDQEGMFKFKGSTSTPAFYLLKVSANNFITLLIDSTEKCTTTGSYKDLSRNYKVKGSVGSEMLQDLNYHFISAKMQLDSLQKISNLHKNDPAYAPKLKQWEAERNGIMTDHSNYLTAFVKKNPFSMASIYALYQKWSENDYVIKDLQTMKVAASALYSVYPKNEQVRALYQNTLEIVKNESSKKLKDVLMENAVNSPDIILPDADGNKRDLWSLHGKYVLLHFWSAKDPASRTLNPVLSEIYNKYRKHGFEIYMVSVDTDRAAWMEAIEDDNLNCINVSDLKGCFQAVTSYNVRELPYNYLLDKQGTIIAKNLKGPVINQILSQIFK